MVDATAPTDAAPVYGPPLPNVVEFRAVTKVYGSGRNQGQAAIRNITFQIADLPKTGELITLVGPSGCGKSTVLRLIAGLAPQHPPSEGQVLVQGEEVEGPSSQRGMVFQSYTSFDNRTVLDNVAFGLECRGMGRLERHELARHWIGKVGLNVDTDQDKYPHELSGGMRQRVAIARTLILKPRIILMDEPFGALDPTTRLHMQDLLVSLWREEESTVFFVTHSITEAVFLGDRCFVFSRSPGVLLHQLQLPRPDRSAAEMQRQPEFATKVNELRAIMEKLEEGKD